MYYIMYYVNFLNRIFNNEPKGAVISSDTQPNFEHNETDNDAGTVLLGGFSDEFNNDYEKELTGRAGMLRLWKMSRADATAGTMLRGIKNPIKSVQWKFEELGEDATEAEIKVLDFLEWYWFKHYPSFTSLIIQILSMIEFGHSVFEVLWNDVTFENEVKLVPILEQRMQTSIENIRSRAKYIQFNNANGDLKDINFDELVFFIIDQYGEDLRGGSMLREAYKSYRFKTVCEGLLGIGIQRSATGIPSIKVPASMNTKSADYKAIKSMMKKIVESEKAFIIYPDNSELTILPHTFNPANSLAVMKYTDQQMTMSILEQFIMLGQTGGGGSYSLGRDQSDMFLDGLQYIIDIISETFSKKIIAPMVEYNFVDIDPTKFVLKGFNLNKKASKEFAEIIGEFIKSGVLKPTTNDEINVRKMMKLSPLTEDQVKERNEKKENDVDNAANISAEKKVQTKAIKLAEDPESKERRKEDQIRSTFIDDNTKTMNFFMQEQLSFISEKLKIDIKKTLEKGKIELRGLKNIQLRGLKIYQNGLTRKMAAISDIWWKNAKGQAKRNNVKLAEEISPNEIEDPELKAYIINQADIVVDDQTTTMKSRAIFVAQASIMKNFSINQTMARVDNEIDTYIAGNKVQVGANAAVANSVNWGWDSFNSTIKTELWGYHFTNDDPVADICIWYQNKTFGVDSAELSQATPALHPRCKSWLDPIYKANTEKKPVLDNEVAPPSIQKTATF